MPLYRIEVPGGGTYRVESETDLTDAQVWQAVQGQISATPAEPTFGERAKAAFGRGLEQVPESAAGVGLGISSLLGTSGEAQRRQQIAAEERQQKGPAPITFEELRKTYGDQGALEALKKLPAYVTEQILQSAPSMAVPIAAGAAAGAVSGPLAPIVAPVVGVGTYGVQQFGQFMRRQAAEKAPEEPLEPGKAAGAAAVTAPLGFFADRLTLGLSKVPTQIAGREIQSELAKRAGQSIAGRAATGATIGVIAEAPTEVLEQAAERWQAGLSLADDDAKREYMEAAAGAVAVGGPLGAATRVAAGKPAEKPAPETTQEVASFVAEEQPAEPTPIQQKIEETTGVAAEPTGMQPMTAAQVAEQRRLAIDEAAKQEEQRAAKEGPRPEVPQPQPVDTGKLYEEMPQATPREELEAKQAEIDKLRLEAGLPTSKGVMPETAKPELPTEPKIVDNRPLEERAAKNRLLVMQNMLKNEGGDPNSLSIVPHPTAKGKFAIQSLDRPVRLQKDLPATAINRPVTPVVIDPIDAYIEIARRTNTPAARRLVRDFEAGIVTREDIGLAVEAERRAGQPMPLNYKGNGEPWFLAPEERKPRGERELPPGARLTREPPEGPQRPFVGPEKPTTPETPPEKPGEEPPPPTGEMPKTLEEFKQRMPVETEVPAIRTANEAGNFRQLAESMATSQNPIIRRVGQLALPVADKIMLKKPSAPGKLGGGAIGIYRYADDSIQMDTRYAGSEWVNAHETVHALVARAQRSPSPKQAPYVRQIEDLYKYAKKELARKGYNSKNTYGLTNEREFVSEAMSNADFQYLLMQIPYKGKKSAWTEFVRIVADMLGIKNTNALTEVLNLVDKLAQVKRPIRTPFDRKEVEYAGFEGVTPQEREANFKKWFGDSKVVDAEGKPLVVYHGTAADFKVFRRTQSGEFGPAIYTTDSPREAGEYGVGQQKPGVNIMPVYVSLKNPYTKGVDSFWKEFGRDDGDAAAVARAQQAGYDGVIAKRPDVYYDNEERKFVDQGDTLTHYIAFNPSQIKSAIGNRGTFSLEEADIEKLEIPKLSPKEPTPERKPTGQQALDIVASTGMQAKPPEPSAKEKVKTALLAAKDDPKMAASSAKKAVQNFVDKVETMAFSGDAKYNNDIRRALIADFNENPEVLGMLLEASQSQAVHSDALATQFITEGGIAYDGDAKKWVAIKKEDNFVKLAQKIEALANKHGLTKQEAERVAHTYFVAKRFKSLAEKQDQRSAEIDRLEAEAKREQDTVRRKGLRSEIDKLKKAEVFITDDQRKMIDPGLKLGDVMPELKDISDTWQAIRVNAIKAMVDGQLWSYETAERMLDNVDYVPFYREEQLEEGEGPIEFLKGLQVKADEYRLKGSQSPVNDVFDNMVRWTQYAINRSVRNHKALQMIDLGKEIKVGDDKMVKQVDKKEKGENVVRVFRDGVQELYEVADPMYMDAFTSISNVAIPSLRFFSWMANMLRQSVVLYPLFSVAQVPQDAFAAMFTSGLKPQYALRIPVLAVKEFLKTIRKTSATHNELKKYGAVGVRDFSAAVARNDVEIAAGLKAPKSVTGKVMESLSHIAMAADNSVRQAVYEASMAQGLSKAEALEKAFDLINFRRRGTSKFINLMGQTVPFFYAYMSVQRTALKTLSGVGISPTTRKEALKTLGYTTAAVMALSLLYVMANAGDEEYEKTPTAIRDRTLHIPGTSARIPLRPDFFLFPKIVTENMYHLITDKGLTDGAKFRKTMSDTLWNAVASPQPIPQAAKPLFEALINYDLFQGRPIVGPFEQKKEAERQFNDNTSELSKILGSAGGVSPMVLDHVIRGMFGSVGGLVLWGTNMAISPVGDVPRPDKNFQDALASIPGTSGFVTKTTESRLKNDFYELRDEIVKANETYKDIKNRSPQELESFISNEKNLIRLGLVDTVEEVTRQLSNIRKAISTATNAPADMMSASDKKDLIDQLREMEKQLMQGIDVPGLRKMAQM